MTPFVAPVMRCKACGAIERPTLTTGPSGTYVAYCQQCGSRIKALPSLAMTQLPSDPPRSRHKTGALAHPVLLAQRCRHCGEVDVPRISGGRGLHAGTATCVHCNGFLRWITKSIMAQLQVEGD
jgi:hypothetical protein